MKTSRSSAAAQGVQPVRAKRTGPAVRAARDAGAQPIVAMVAMAALLTLTLLGPIMTMSDTGEGAGSLSRQVGYLLIAALAAVSVKPLRHLERLLVVPWPLVLALAWCWLSIGWALFPEIALRRVALTTIIIWSLFVLVRQIGYERALLLVRIAFGAALVANFAVALFDPQLGIHGMEEGLNGDWRGIMMHKNVAGMTSALTVILFAFDGQRVPIAVRLGVIGAALLFLWLSVSKTSMVAVVAALAVGFLFYHMLFRFQAVAERLSRDRRATWAAIAVPVLLIAVGLWLNRDAILHVLNDPAAFTGRTWIWGVLVRSFMENPVLGVGYGSFWNVGPTGPVFRYAEFAWAVGVGQGHNGYLDLLAQIGVPGLLFVLFAVVAWPLRLMLRTSGIEPGAAALVAATILFCIVHNGSESTLFDRDSIGEVILILVIALLRARTGMLAPATASPGRSAADDRTPAPRPSRLRL